MLSSLQYLFDANEVSKFLQIISLKSLLSCFCLILNFFGSYNRGTAGKQSWTVLNWDFPYMYIYHRDGVFSLCS